MSLQKLLQYSTVIHGIDNMLAGENLNYHCAVPHIRDGFIVRAKSESENLRWCLPETGPGSSGRRVTYYWLAGIGCNLGIGEFTLSSSHWGAVVFKTGPERFQMIENEQGAVFCFSAVMEDECGDLFGYMFFQVPEKPEQPAEKSWISISAKPMESNVWVMVHPHRLTPGVDLTTPHVIARDTKGPRQIYTVRLIHPGPPENYRVELDDIKIAEGQMQFGVNLIEIRLPLEAAGGNFALKAVSESGVMREQSVNPDPARPMEIYLLHHTHLDIGYTHHQEEVLELQCEHLRTAMEISKKTIDYPKPAQFRWLPEALWAVEYFLENSQEDERNAFLKAVRDGSIGLDGLYCNSLTGLNSAAELLELTACARKLQRQYGLPVTSAMITDIPGQTWGLVTAMAGSGLKYLSLGPNSGHRIGYVFDWADQPFYWVSQSGKSRILTWVHGKGYSWFHTSIEAASNPELIKNKLTDDRVKTYMEELIRTGYPYDMTVLRVNIGSDNGPPDSNLPDIVRDWNERYESPRLILSTTAEAFSEFEKRYSRHIPEIQGDFTPYWEDGAASTARETAWSRNLKEQMGQLSAAAACIPESVWFPDRAEQFWKNIILFDEHTWGSADSISDSENPDVIQQWQWKKKLLGNAEETLNGIRTEIWENGLEFGSDVTGVQIFNQQPWPVTDIVSFRCPCRYLTVTNLEGDELPVQKNSDDLWIFLAEDIPETGCKSFRIHRDSPGSVISSGLHYSELELENQYIRIRIDPATGFIASITDKVNRKELMDTASEFLLNEYLYVPGRNPLKVVKSDSKPEIRLTETGPLRAALEIVTSPEGCEKLTQTIRMDAYSPGFDIENALVRSDVKTPEGIHFAFPFSRDFAKVNMDLPLAAAEPGRDQIQGSNCNWFTVQNWLSFSCGDTGIMLLTPDAPLVELGGLHADATVTGWLRSVEKPLPVFSYVMNNYWETNYKLNQPGAAAFRYRIELWSSDSPEQIHQSASQFAVPLLSRFISGDSAECSSLFFIAGSPFVTAVSISPAADRSGVYIRLINRQSGEAVVNIISDRYPIRYRSNLYGDCLECSDRPLKFSGWELKSVLLTDKSK